jgi:hypothetical protein
VRWHSPARAARRGERGGGTGGAAARARWRHGGTREVEAQCRRDSVSEVEAQREQR